MASTAFTGYDCPPTRDIHWRNSSTTPLSEIPRRFASADVIYTTGGFPTTLTPPNSNSSSAPTLRPAKAGFSCNAHFTRNPDLTLSRDLSESHVDALPGIVARTPPLPRKKSGEPLKPSLKLRSRPLGSLATGRVNSSPSKSAPATPTHKGVRFHSQLEHVKHFVAEQKPLAVSCDGSPTDTSGTDSEFAPFIYPRDDDLKERPLVMHRIDVPIASSLAEDTRDIAVENIDLVGTTVEGIVRVRNLAFNKSIAVYFTLDNWGTTSEVTARYKASLPNGTFDWFRFSINLADVLSRAQAKTLYLAARYAVSGREIWDNNSGRNYQVRIVHEKALKVNKEAMVESCEEPFQADDINHVMDLRRRLEQVVKHGCPSETISSILSQESRRRWESFSPTPTPPLRDGTPSSKVKEFFAARYDIAALSRCPPAATRQTGPAHPDTDEVSSFFPDRDPDSDHNSDDGNIPVPSRRRQRSGARNHTRVQYSVPLPLPDPTSARPQTQPYARFNSFPPHPSPKQQLSRDESAITSSSPSCSLSSSPSSSPAELVSPTRLMDMDENRNSPIQYLDYHDIVNRYCFYTGPRPRGVLEHPGFIPLSPSASSIEEFP